MPSVNAANCAGGSCPCCRADGRSPKPEPWRVCTWPPSWSAATHGRSPPGAAAAQRSVTAATSATDAVDLPCRNTPPTPSATSASAADRPDSGTPTTNSCATCARRSSEASAVVTWSSSAGGSPSGFVGAADVVAAVDDEPGDDALPEWSLAEEQPTSARAISARPASRRPPIPTGPSSSIPVRVRGVSLEELLSASRAGVRRLSPHETIAAAARGALVVDTRTDLQRRRQGELPRDLLPGAVVIDRTVLEWRLGPVGEHPIPQAKADDLEVVVVCRQGYSSSLAAASLRAIGLAQATDLEGGVEAWLAAGLPTDDGPADIRE